MLFYLIVHIERIALAVKQKLNILNTVGNYSRKAFVSPIPDVHIAKFSVILSG